MEIRICKDCKLAFEYEKAPLTYNYFCSKLCYDRDWRKHNREKHNARARTYQKKCREAKRLPGTCKNCNIVFFRKWTREFCSDTCQQSYYQRSNRKLVNKWRDKYYHAARQKTPWQFILMSIRSRAKKDNIPFNLTKEWCITRWTGRCELCNLPFVLNEKRHPLSPSIDKIDPNKGYVQNNCRFVLWGVNAMKGIGTDEDVFVIANALTTKHVHMGLLGETPAHNPSTSDAFYQTNLGIPLLR